jgi:2-C-methyl-D-erythritol 4-phosphate cytidylyltransferase
MMKKYILIVAGGKGRRMGTSRAKQFLEVGGLPLLMHTFNAFSALENNFEFILVLPARLIAPWKELCEIYHFNTPHQIAESGPKRFHSVKSGLNLVPENVWVAIHDAARPFVSKQVIAACFAMAERKGNAIPVVPVNESVRETNGTFNKVLDREKLRLVQTPQVFHSSSIKQAYQQPYNESFTDDATVLESSGQPIHLVEGNRENIKITNPSDLLFAQALIASK